MAHRHDVHKRARGGRTVYAGAESNVAKEAEHNLHKRGGKVGGKMHGHKGKHRIAKKRGGGVGSDTNPFTSAGKGGMDTLPAEHGKGHSSGGGGFTGQPGK